MVDVDAGGQGLTQEQFLYIQENVMSDISEDCWAAGWMDGLSQSLWRLLTEDAGGGGVRFRTNVAATGLDYGMGLAVGDARPDLLIALAKQTGVWLDYRQQTPAVPLAEMDPPMEVAP